jgi:hypothetical protein
MTIGSTEATLTEGETATAITMVVAPYVDSATWRTSCPSASPHRPSAARGLESDDQTAAVIVDAEKLLGSAKAGKEYTIPGQILGVQPAVQRGRLGRDRPTLMPT